MLLKNVSGWPFLSSAADRETGRTGFFLGLLSGLSLTLLNFYGFLKVFLFYNSVKKIGLSL